MVAVNSRILCAATALLLGGCSLTTFENASCAQDIDCWVAFGLETACGSRGFCREAAQDPRCTDTWPEDLFTNPDRFDDQIIIGTLFDRSSDTTEIKSATLAVKQANIEGGLDGRDFAMVHCTYEEDVTIDDLDSSAATTRVSTYLTETLGVSTIIGPATSSQTVVAYNAVGALGTLIISPSATGTALTTIDGEIKTDEEPGLFWRTAPPDSLQGFGIAQDMLARGRGHVAVIYELGPYGEGLAEVFQEHFEAGGGTTQMLSFSNAVERDEAVAITASDDPLPSEEVLFISGEPDDITAFLIAAALLDAFATKGLFLPDAGADTDILDDTDEAGASSVWGQIRGTRPAVPSGIVYDTFRISYAAEYDGEDATSSVYNAHTFDAAWLAIYGNAWSVNREADLSGKSVARGLRRISDGTTVEIKPSGWTEVKDFFANGTSIDVAGASGALDFDPITEETTAAIEVWVINAAGDGFEVVETYEP